MMPSIDPKVAAVYKSVGKLLATYRSGKLPKAFKVRVLSLSRFLYGARFA